MIFIEAFKPVIPLSYCFGAASFAQLHFLCCYPSYSVFSLHFNVLIFLYLHYMIDFSIKCDIIVDIAFYAVCDGGVYG